HGAPQSPYDWRYAGHPAADTAPMAVVAPRRKRSRVGAMVTGAAAIAVVSAGVGAVAMTNQHDPSAESGLATALATAPRQAAAVPPAADLPSGSVEAVAA